MNPDWVHEPDCDEWGFERTYLNDECLICLLIIKVRRNALDKALEALNEMPELGGGLAPFVRRHAALQVIHALKENSE